MRSRISVIIILISIVLLVVATVNGIKIGDFQILSVSELVEKNDNLQNKIGESDELISKTYPENQKTLEDTFKQYKVQKQKYEDLSGVSGDKVDEIYETKQYDISYLWRVLGKYAENRGLILDISVKKNETGENLYDFNFTVTGPYTSISQFLVDIENDSDLYFRIYNFRMDGKETTDEKGQRYITTIATFVVKGVNIDPDTIR